MAPLPRPRSAPQQSRGGLAALAVAGTVAWCCSSSGGFVASSSRVLGRCGTSVARQAGYSFGVQRKEDHWGLLLAEKETGLRVSSIPEGEFEGKHKSLRDGHLGTYNTVVGDKELPQTGRSYWEVKIVKKPTDAWEYIGVAEPSVHPRVPLNKQKEAKGWFWGGNWEDAFVYIFLENKPGWNDRKLAWADNLGKMCVEKGMLSQKVVDRGDLKQTIKDLWTGPGTHVGQIMRGWPKFEAGTVVGVDVDMDDGSLAFWANGEFLGIVRDTEGNQVNLKGKKLAPAVSVFGRNTGMVKQNTVMEIRTGMDAPPRPTR
eukprot:gb/GFBE01035050.1/.p1 GENE.gb/GFBE01035050.1/~~gb/GFBE01035050.1/.p1  ORF type:complete len:315 (+),score=77.33 gb/GFBE01035050.1/:1-945(+)